MTFQDPRTFEERDEGRAESSHTKASRISSLKSKVRFAIAYSRVSRAVRNADALYCQAKYVIPKAMRLYGLKDAPGFLPNPVQIPQGDLKKAPKATVCFLGRWGPRKRPEYFFELARRFPHVQFIAMGGCQPAFAERERVLREKYASVPNLQMVGWTQGDAKSKVLETSWILVNTSWRECLPVSYLEACAHKCRGPIT